MRHEMSQGYYDCLRMMRGPCDELCFMIPKRLKVNVENRKTIPLPT